MIHYKQGNLLDVTSGIIVHGCNMQGVMGAGVAKAVKQKYPQCFEVYQHRLRTQYTALGGVIYYYSNKDLLIANALTQRYYGSRMREVNYAAIVNSFQHILSHRSKFGINLKTINFPKIGAGLGGGDWSIIEQLINDCDPDDTVEKICWEL